MTLCDSCVYAHDSPIQAPSRLHHSHSNASARSRSTRSPSPIITFTPTPLSSDARSVKDITRKVIKTLEGLGHLDSSEVAEPDCETDNKTELIDEGDVSCSVSSLLSHENHLKNCVLMPNDQHIQDKFPECDLPRKIDWEIPRKILHSSIGFFALYLYISDGDVKLVVFSLWTALAIIIPTDILRLRYPRFERIFERVLGFLMRESEKKSSNGVIWYILGVNFALTCYPKDVAAVAILILSWADTTASTFGRLWGSKTPRLPAHTPVLRLPLSPRKSVAGFIAAAVTGALIAFGFWGWIAPIQKSNTTLTWSWNDGARGWTGLGAVGIFSGLMSGVAEALALGSLDDNLTLPIISGGCIWGFLKLLGLLSSR